MTTVHDNIGRFKYNMQILKSRRPRIAHVREQYLGTLNARGIRPHEQIPPDVVQAVRFEIREKMRAEKRRNTRIGITVISLVAVVVISVFVWILGFMIPGSV